MKRCPRCGFYMERVTPEDRGQPVRNGRTRPGFCWCPRCDKPKSKRKGWGKPKREKRR